MGRGRGQNNLKGNAKTDRDIIIEMSSTRGREQIASGTAADVNGG